MDKAQFEKIWGHPMEEYFSGKIIGYYADGRQYDYRYENKWAGNMQQLLDDATKHHWSIKFDEASKVFTLEKHFPSGMYRIATYTPYDRDKLDLAVHYDH